MLKQQGRVGKLTTQLGKDALVLIEMEGHEALSELFSFEVEALSEQEAIDFDGLLGTGCSIEIDCGQFGKRQIHGVVTEGAWVGMTPDREHRYRLTLRPWLWLLGKTTDCRIYHEKTVVDIIKDVFSRRGFSAVEWRTRASYPTLHYTVQYRETDLNFVSRLLEQHGISYFFEHNAGEHTLILADEPSSHTAAKGISHLTFMAVAAGSHLEAEVPHVSAWEATRSLRSGRFALNDYNHLTPNSMLATQSSAGRKHQHGSLEVYDHPGMYRTHGEGEQYVRWRNEAEQSSDHVRNAVGVAPQLWPGATIGLKKHPRGAENRDWLVTEVSHRITRQDYGSATVGDSQEPYKASYRFQRSSEPFRPLMRTPKPLIHSLQTALVTGAEGEEIDCDNHGRILVKFYWDRHGEKSCRLRVSQVWGSKTWGGQIIPRIGMEVMVAYIDGDPDRPIVVGSVPDPENNTVPYTLPDNKSKSVWRSNTYKGRGYNEISFEDAAGKENFHIHAQKDMTFKVLHDYTTRVDNSTAVSVGKNMSTEIGANMNQEIAGSQNTVVGASGPAVVMALASVGGLMGQTAGITGEALGRAGGMGAAQGLALGVVSQAAQALLSGAALKGRSGVVKGGSPRGDQSAGLAGAGTQLLDGVGKLFQGMGGAQNNFVSLMKTDTIGQLRTETVGQTKVTNVGKTFYTHVGDKYKIEAGEELEIVVGKAHLVMRKDGSVIINGTKFVWTSSGPAEIYGSVIDLNKPG